MTRLVSMHETTYAAFVANAIVNYANDNIAAGRWPAATAIARSRTEFERLLPEGLATPDQHLFTIEDEVTGEAVGFLWYAVTGGEGTRSAYVYDLEVAPAHRRRGHARAAFIALESIVRDAGLPHIGLHVFSFNAGAQALYTSLGYEVTGLNMQKMLKANGA